MAGACLAGKEGWERGEEGVSEGEGEEGERNENKLEGKHLWWLKLIRVVDDVLYPWDDLKLRSRILLYKDPRLRKAYISSHKPRKVAPRMSADVRFHDHKHKYSL